MQRRLIAAGLAMAMVSILGATYARQSPEGEIERLTLEINQAFVRNDLQGVARHVARDITWISHTSLQRQDGRDVFVNALRETMARKQTIRWQERDLRVQVWGDAAIVSFFYDHHARLGNRTIDRVSRATYGFARRGGRWLLVHDHSSVAHGGS